MWAARPLGAEASGAERSISHWSPFTLPPGAPARIGIAVAGEVAWRGLEGLLRGSGQAVPAPSHGPPLWVPGEP